MEKVYFLIAIGVIAFALVYWLTNREHKLEQKAKKQKAKVHHMAKLHQMHHTPTPTVHHGLPSRTTSFPPHHTGAWESRHQRAGEEKRDGHAISATRLFADGENQEVEPDHGLAMPAIKYEPESVPKAFQPRR